MKFDTLKDKCYYYRGLTDYKLMPKGYVLMMLDGKKFSSYTKKFKKPFDEVFINAMNETAMYLCKNIEGAKIAYTQSDEISILLTDFEKPETDCWFGYRLNKMLSIAASLATSKFNQLMTLNLLDCPCSKEDAIEMIREMSLAQFDCKVWSVPTKNDVVSWFLFRQNDCIRNSVSMVGSTYFSHNELMFKNTDMVKQMLIDEKNINWDEFPAGQKQGRIIVKEKFVDGVAEEDLVDELNLYLTSPLPWEENPTKYTIRNKWVVKDAPLLNDSLERDIFKYYIPSNSN